MKPIVSIGMPVYNGDEYLGRAIESLLKQTYKNYELIISNNNSTDNTEIICIKYLKEDSRIHYVKQKINIGAVKNFEFVLSKSVGKYFMWASCDDIWMPTFLSKTLNLLENNPSIVCAVPIVNFDDGKISNATSSIVGNSKQRFSNFLSDPSDNSRFYGLYRIDIIKNVISKTNWDYYAGDWSIVAEIALCGNIVNIPEPLMTRKFSNENKYVMMMKNKHFYNVFPLSKFTSFILKNNEAWSFDALNKILRLNILHHIIYIKHESILLYNIYKFIYKIIKYILNKGKIYE